MAQKEPYDYVATSTADVSTTLTLTPHGRVTEQSRENAVIHLGDDESEERIVLSSTPVFYLSWSWNVLSASDAGTILDLYHTSAQGRGKSFQCTHDGHTYVVRFDCDLSRTGQRNSRLSIPSVRLKILGKVEDPA